ncbi:MAG TPA: esterase-like activity of phytase family protein [Pseudolabrys sp.]|nr:esterase-like activity of phytase family protein [Pseudolabrys sp.]
MQFTQRRLIAGGTFVAALVLVVVSFVVADALHTSRAPAHIRIEATPIVSFDTRDPSRTRFGALEFRGGLALVSNYKAFGGVSALHIDPDGAHFLAVTDNGSWLRGRIVYRGGRPAGIADAEMAPMLGPDGKPLFERGWYDAESLTLGNDGLYYVGIERVEKIVRFDYRRDGFAARAQEVPVPGDFKTFTYNKSLECLASPPRGSPKADDLIVVTEHSLDAAGNHRAYLLNGAHVVRFSVKRTDDFDVSDCTVLAPDDLLLLERRFWVARGIAVRIRRLRLDDMKQDALVDGPTVLEADLAYQIDNMEGIAVTRNAQGETIITLVSDDNFSPIQRNLLLQFALVEH